MVFPRGLFPSCFLTEFFVHLSHLHIQSVSSSSIWTLQKTFVEAFKQILDYVRFSIFRPLSTFHVQMFPLMYPFLNTADVRRFEYYGIWRYVFWYLQTFRRTVVRLSSGSSIPSSSILFFERKSVLVLACALDWIRLTRRGKWGIQQQ